MTANESAHPHPIPDQVLTPLSADEWWSSEDSAIMLAYSSARDAATTYGSGSPEYDEAWAKVGAAHKRLREAVEAAIKLPLEEEIARLRAALGEVK